jgi:dTDP-4-dehydrorhamnose reductase
MNVLVTGGSGLLGINWATCCSSFQNITLGLHHRKIDVNGVRTEKINLASEAEILEFLRRERIDLVVHAAANTSIELCEKFPVEANHVNVELTEHVARATETHGAKFVFISTDQLFDGTKSMVTEDELANPLNVYGETKRRAEVRVMSICDKPLIIRTNFYGVGTEYRKSISDWIIESLKNNQQIKLFDDIYFTPILIDRLITAIATLLEGSHSGIFNIVSNERLSKLEFGLKLAETFGLNKKLICKSQFQDRLDLANRPLDMSLSNKKFIKTTGFKLGSIRTHLNSLLSNSRNANIFI